MKDKTISQFLADGKTHRCRYDLVSDGLSFPHPYTGQEIQHESNPSAAVEIIAAHETLKKQNHSAHIPSIAAIIDKHIASLVKDKTLLIAELQGAMLGLSAHPIVPYGGFCISAKSKEKLNVINDIIKRYEQL